MRLRTIRRLLPALVPLTLAAASPASAHDQITVTMTESDCRRLVKHVSAPDVAYRPGLDARGREVAPADLGDLGGGAQIAVPETIEIDIEVELQDRFGIPANPTLFDADARIGKVELRPDGRVTFNGQPLQDEAQAELTRRCQEILYGLR